MANRQFEMIILALALFELLALVTCSAVPLSQAFAFEQLELEKLNQQELTPEETQELLQTLAKHYSDFDVEFEEDPEGQEWRQLVFMLLELGDETDCKSLGVLNEAVTKNANLERYVKSLQLNRCQTQTPAL